MKNGWERDTIYGEKPTEHGDWMVISCDLVGYMMVYPLVMTNVAIEHGHWTSELSWVVLLTKVIFDSYVSLPQGTRT